MQEGRVVYHKARQALEEGGFNLRKWCANIPSLQEEMMVGEKSAPELMLRYTVSDGSCLGVI